MRAARIEVEDLLETGPLRKNSLDDGVVRAA